MRVNIEHPKVSHLETEDPDDVLYLRIVDFNIKIYWVKLLSNYNIALLLIVKLTQLFKEFNFTQNYYNLLLVFLCSEF